MATLYIAEFPMDHYGPWITIQAAVVPPLSEQAVGIGSSSTSSNAFSPTTGLVRLHTDSICSIAFGSSPTATATNARMVVGQTEYFLVHPGQKVAVIVNT